MSITKILLAGAAGTVLASGMAAAGEPMKLSTAEMDEITAGAFFVEAYSRPSALAGLRGSFEASVRVSGSDTTALPSGNRQVNVSGEGTSAGTGRGFILPGTRFGLDAFVFGGLAGFGQADASQ